MVKFPILQFGEISDLKSFVDFWSKFYERRFDEELYNPFIIKPYFEDDDIQKLYKWKNGMTLSARKDESLTHKILVERDTINNFKLESNFKIDNFKTKFSHISLVWQVFLLHIINPAKFPIYDQHVHRAYNFIHELEYRGINFADLTNKAKEEFYFEKYLTFVSNRGDIDLKIFDEAMWSFGKFLSTKWNLRVLS